jgi:enoyl-CoA hydratase
MPYEHLLIQVADRVATVTVNRPDKLNALDDAVVAELGRAADELRARDDVAGILVTGAGAKAFVAGADIGELARQGPFDAKARALRGQAAFRKLETSPKPVVAAVNGFALGGGCELAMACHLRVASAKAKFGQPEVNLGITPGYGGTQRLPRLVGKGRALDIILTGRMVDAQEALQIGLVNRVVPPEDVLTEAGKLLRGILAKGPLAVALALEAVDRGMEMSLEEGLQLEANHFGLAAASADMREGMTAFLEKRDAHFTGA